VHQAGRFLDLRHGERAEQVEWPLVRISGRSRVVAHEKRP